MRRWIGAVAGVLVLVAAIVGGDGGVGADGTPVATPAGCPVTRPNGVHPPGMRPDDPGNYGNDALWTNLTMWSEEPGIVRVPDDAHIGPDGSARELKWAWYRFAPGTLTIAGRRLDGPAGPLEAWVPEGYGSIGFQVSGLTFPAAGCWEVTGRVGDAELTFVVLVVLPPGRAGTPAA